MSIINISDPLEEFGLSEDEDGAREYTTSHIVTVDDPDDYQPTILTDPLMPQPHVTPSPWDPFATCRRRKLEPFEDSYTWMLVITWSNKSSTEQKEANPLLRPVKGGLRCVDDERPVFADAFGVPTVNTAGDLYAGLTAVQNVEVITVTYLTEDYPYFLRSLNNTVNAFGVWILGGYYTPRTCWMKNLDLPEDPTKENEVWYWQARYEIHIDYRGYTALLPNAGQNAVVYQVRDNEDAEWNDVTFSEYDEKEELTDRRKDRRRCLDGVGNDAGGDTWLDRYGQETLPAFGNGVIGTASAAEDSDVVTVSTSVFDESSVGMTITVGGVPPFDKPTDLLVIEFLSGTEVRVNKTSGVAFSNVPVSVSGCLFNALQLQPLANWEDLPLPPTPPDLAALNQEP